jgi:cation transport ATPase
MSGAVVAHHIPGRLRVKIPAAKGNPALLAQAQAALESLDGVHEVRVNQTTGSVIVEYDPQVHHKIHDHVHEHATKNNLFSLTPHAPATSVDRTLKELEEEAEFLASRSSLARVIVDFLRDCDMKVKQISNNSADLKVLVPLALAAYSIAVIELTAATPMWATLGLFSFNHFLELHSHELDSDAGSEAHPKKLAAKALRQI